MDIGETLEYIKNIFTLLLESTTAADDTVLASENSITNKDESQGRQYKAEFEFYDKYRIIFHLISISLVAILS